MDKILLKNNIKVKFKIINRSSTAKVTLKSEHSSYAHFLTKLYYFVTITICL